MNRLPYMLFLFLAAGYTAQSLSAQDEPSAAEVAGSDADSGVIEFTLSLQPWDTEFTPANLPPSKALTLQPIEVDPKLGVNGLTTEAKLGWPKDQGAVTKLLVTRPSTGEPYSQLYIDSDGNGEFDEPVITAKKSDERGLIWTKFSAELKANFVLDTAATVEFPVELWLSVKKAKSKPTTMRLSRRSYRLGEVLVGEQKALVVLSDGSNDEVLGAGDWWEIRPVGSDTKAAMRAVDDFYWLGEQAYKLEIASPLGDKARLVPHDPGVTRKQDLAARDPFGIDGGIAKAEKPLEFRHDADAAIVEAKEKNLPCFVKFETTWCPPCKLMTSYVFTAQDVVDASEGVVCVKVDGDERTDLLEKYGVEAFPTGVMFGADGTEVSRFVGYQNVEMMSKFLKERVKPE